MRPAAGFGITAVGCWTAQPNVTAPKPASYADRLCRNPVRNGLHPVRELEAEWRDAEPIHGKSLTQIAQALGVRL